jgi:hypothetical protein
LSLGPVATASGSDKVKHFLGKPVRRGFEGARWIGMSKVQVVSELWQFMRENKKYWLAPIVITLVLVGALLVLAKSSAIAPFIYTLF